MTQLKRQVDKIAELNSVFLTLDELNQEYALTLLQTLRFAQTIQRNSSSPEDMKKTSEK